MAIGVAIALVPPPSGLAAHAGYFFAIFAGVIVALIALGTPWYALAR